MPDATVFETFQSALGAFRRKDHWTASSLCEQILEIEPDEPHALMLLAEISRAADLLDAELSYLSRAVAATPAVALLHERLAECHSRRGNLADAAAAYREASRLEPERLSAIAGLARILELQDDAEAARRLLEPHVAAATTEPAIYRIYLRMLVNAGELDAAIDLGEQLDERGIAESMGLRDALFQLAMAYERREDFARALDTAHRANRMLAPSFDHAAQSRLIDRFISTFTRDRLAGAARSRERSELPVFIVGVPRCGSTLTERILDAHPDVHGVGEHRALLPIIRGLPGRLRSTLPYPECVRDLDRDDAEATGRAYIDALRPLAPDASRLVNKALGHFLHLGLIQILFPGARVIHCRRDPLDTCLSCYMQALPPAVAPFASDLADLAWFYREYERLMHHWRDVLDLPILDVHYEELVDDQENVSRRMIEFCGLPWDDACLRFFATDRQDRTLSYDQVRRPMYRSSVGRAARFGALLDPLREALEQQA